MSEETKCPVCGKKEWIRDEKYPIIRKCAYCGALYPTDVILATPFKGMVYNQETNEHLTFEKLEKRMEKNV